MYEDQLRRAPVMTMIRRYTIRREYFVDTSTNGDGSKEAKDSDHVGIFEIERWLLWSEWKERKSRKISAARLPLHVHLSKHPLNKISFVRSFFHLFVADFGRDMLLCCACSVAVLAKY
jgi:hypothetical protein